MLMNTICYKQKVPTVYNRGTKYESSCDHFLYQYVYGDDEHAQKAADKLNLMLKEGVERHDGLDMTNIAYFYINKQEEMY